MLTCNNCSAILEELNYYYDDSWGYRGSLVWGKNGIEGNLYYCPTCGNIRVIFKST
jgi:hypothetical protein